MRLIPKNALGNARVLPTLTHIRSQDSTSVFNRLMVQREEAAEAWPKNIRLEPVVKKEAFKRVQADVRNRLKRLLRET
jgi:RNase P protein component